MFLPNLIKFWIHDWVIQAENDPDLTFMVRNMTTLVEQIPTYLPCPTMFFNMDDPRKKSNLLHHPFSSFKNAKLTVHIVLTNSHDGHRWLATIRTSFIFLNIDQENSQEIQNQLIYGPHFHHWKVNLGSWITWYISETECSLFTIWRLKSTVIPKKAISHLSIWQNWCSGQFYHS